MLFNIGSFHRVMANAFQGVAYARPSIEPGFSDLHFSHAAHMS
jgi:hypothetical protein